jgi:hypothetical protein
VPAQEIMLSVRNDDLDESKLNTVTRELIGTLNREGGLEASTEASEGAAGSKGVWTTIGGIAMKLVGGSEAVKGLMGVLQAYAARNNSFTIDMTKPDGTKITINAQNLSGSAFQQTMQQVTDFVKS